MTGMRTRTQSDAPDIERSLVALLNKCARSNYKALVTKFREAFPDGGRATSRIILDKMTFHPQFVGIYAAVLTEMAVAYGNSLEDCVKADLRERWLPFEALLASMPCDDVEAALDSLATRKRTFAALDVFLALGDRMHESMCADIVTACERVVTATETHQTEFQRTREFALRVCRTLVAAGYVDATTRAFARHLRVTKSGYTPMCKFIAMDICKTLIDITRRQ